MVNAVLNESILHCVRIPIPQFVATHPALYGKDRSGGIRCAFGFARPCFSRLYSDPGSRHRNLCRRLTPLVPLPSSARRPCASGAQCDGSSGAHLPDIGPRGIPSDEDARDASHRYREVLLLLLSLGLGGVSKTELSGQEPRLDKRVQRRTW
jgi:hypothetical protein